MSIAQSFKNRQINQRKYSVKILSPIPECSYFPYFFDSIEDKIPYEYNEYSVIAKNKQNLKQITNEESQRVKSEINEISQLFKKFDMEIPPIIQKGLSDAAQIFDKKYEKSHIARLCRFTPFSNQSSLRTSEESKAVLLRFFDVEAANKLNSTRIKKIDEYDPETISPTTKLAKEGVYIPPALNFDLSTLMLQTFVEVYDDDQLNEKSTINNLPKERNLNNTQENMRENDKNKKVKIYKSSKSKKKKKGTKNKKSKNVNPANEENDQPIIDNSENTNNDNDDKIKSTEDGPEGFDPLKNDDDIADDEEIKTNDDDIAKMENDEVEIQNKEVENENKDIPEDAEFINTENPNEDNQILSVENDHTNNEEGENNQDLPIKGNENNEEDLSDNFEIPFCEESVPNEEYMNCSYTEKLTFELESLGFTLPSNRNILVANAFCVVNGIDPKEIDHKVERANKAKEFLRDFTIDHLPQIEEHNQRVAMNEFLNQSLT